MAKSQPRKLDLSRLSPAAQAALERRTETVLPPPKPLPTVSHDWLFALSPAARRALETPPAEPAVAEEERDEAAYILVAAHDGAWPVIKKFRTPEGLAKELGRLEGQDVVALPYAGIPLVITKGPQRYLILADGKSAVTIPTSEGAVVKRLDADLVGDVPFQEDGYLGPDVLLTPRPLVPRLGRPRPKVDVPDAAGDGDADIDDDEPGPAPSGPSVTI